jgi:hypothetical protein
MRRASGTLTTALGLLLGVLALSLPGGASAAPADDAYIQGYAAAILEREFHVAAPSLRVRDGVITLGAADLAGVDRARVMTALAGIRGAARVDIVETAPASPTAGVSPPAPAPGAPAPAAPASAPTPGAGERRSPRVLEELQVGVLPGGELFKPLIADPRWPHFAASYQHYLNDKNLRGVGAASFGETFTLYRERLGGAWWETGIQAGVFALFDLDSDSRDLVNADYFAAVVGGYRYGSFSALARLFHQSSHLGDEFLLRSRVSRLNLSYESVDLKLSYELGEAWRLYAGAGYLFDQEPANLSPWSLQWGVEFRSPWPAPDAGFRPVAAVDVQNREENDWHTDFSLRVGIQFDGVLATRNLQFLLEYFRGHSPNGQFYKEKIDYIGVGAHFHF